MELLCSELHPISSCVAIGTISLTVYSALVHNTVSGTPLVQPPVMRTLLRICSETPQFQPPKMRSPLYTVESSIPTTLK